MLINHEISTILEQADCVFSSEQIQQALNQMAVAITHELEHAHPIVLSVMTGALVMTGHLLTKLNFLLELDYLHVTRYRGAKHGGELHWLAKPRFSMLNRAVLILDDIFDGGVTLSAVVDFCKKAHAKTVHTAVLINKQRQREPGVHIEPDFIGFHAKDQYLFGFGLDHEENWRNLTAIYAMKS